MSECVVLPLTVSIVPLPVDFVILSVSFCISLCSDHVQRELVPRPDLALQSFIMDRLVYQDEDVPEDFWSYSHVLEYIKAFALQMVHVLERQFGEVTHLGGLNLL